MSCAACGATAHGSCSGVSRARRERGWQYICRRCEGDAVEERCLMCRKIFRTNARRVRCECGAEVHASCSGMTRGALARGTPFRCVQCGGHPVPEPEEGLRAEERAECLVCGVTLRRGASFAVCETCGFKAHKKCTGQRRGATGWRCHQCAPPPARDGPPQSPPSVEEPPARPQEEPPPRNDKCPSCTAKIRRTRDPLICKCCRKQYHIKCAQTTRDALVEQRRQGTWECGMCREERPPRVEPTPDGRTSMRKIERRFGLRMMQWNCDGIATKKDELAEMMKREKIHLAMIQETKLGNKDATPNIRGYTAYRKDRYGSGVTKARGGGLCTYIREDLPHWEKPTQATGILEAQTIVVPREGTHNLEITNLYIPPARGEGAMEAWRGALRQLEELELHQGSLWCGDINAHNEIWDPHMVPDRRGEELVELMAERGLATLNDGSPTRHDRRENRDAPGRSAPDVSITKLEECERFQWEVITDLSSDHLPVMIEWRTEINVNKKPKRIELNLERGDWVEYRRIMEEKVRVVEEERDVERKLVKITNLMETATEVCPVKIFREVVTPWMTAEIRELRRRRNRARRDMANRREEWTEICRELVVKTAEAKRATWRKQLEKIKEEKSVSRAWGVVKQLGGGRGDGHGGAMLYEGKWRITPRAKANAFIQEYANISRSRTNKETRKERKRVAQHLRAMRPRTEVEKDFTLQELDKAIRSLKLGKAPGPDGIRPEFLKHLPASAKIQLLEIANHSWQRHWIPQAWRSATIIPILKKGKGKVRVMPLHP